MRGYRFRIYGKTGHRQRASFGNSIYIERTDGMAIEFRCSDVTGTNEFVDMLIFCDSLSICIKEAWGQILDGIFENCRVGKVCVKSFNYFEKSPSNGVRYFKGH